MAKKSRRKHKRKVVNQPEFFEALPMAAPLPLVVPHPEAAIEEGTRLARDYARAAGQDVFRLGQTVWAKLRSRTARRTYISAIIIGTIAASTVAALIAVSTLSLYASDISSPAALLAKKKTGITILDRNNAVLYQGYGATGGQNIPLKDLPMTLRQATLAAEDPRFYQHPGFSWKATARAIFVDATQGNKAEGGSTITQQLVKNALLTPDKSYIRKYREILLATAVENKYSKDEILNMYLNEVYYGEGSSGVEAASQTYFHKPAKDLTLSESALLAGLPLGPSRLDPAMHPKSAKERRDFVLDKMASLKYISQSEATAAKVQPIQVYGKDVAIRAPHFVFYVLDQLKQKYGLDAVEQGGMTVKTSIDITKQDAAQSIVAKQINKLSSHHVTNGGLISLDPSTGDILSMVGSYDYNAPGYGNYNITLAKLQPGSSFKPFVYITAFEKGWNGATKVDDAPISLPNGNGTMYTPQNYDLKFRGPVTLRQALSNSLNIPAIKVLQFATIPASLSTAKSLGVDLGDPSKYGLSVVLGAGDARPIDMAAAYGGFATGGLKVTPRSILSVEDRTGKKIFTAEKTAPQPRVLDPRYVAMITSILSDNKARTPEFGANSPLKLSRPAAAKTGTTNDFRDNWTVGYTPNLVTAVWVGNNDHSPMQNVDGITGAAPIWHDYMEQALASMPVMQFTLPAGVTADWICASDGGIVSPTDSSGYDEIFLNEAQPTKPCGWSHPAPSAMPNNPTSTAPPPNPTVGGMGGGTSPSVSPAPTPNNSPVPSPPPSPTPAPTPNPAGG